MVGVIQRREETVAKALIEGVYGKDWSPQLFINFFIMNATGQDQQVVTKTFVDLFIAFEAESMQDFVDKEALLTVRKFHESTPDLTRLDR